MDLCAAVHLFVRQRVVAKFSVGKSSRRTHKQTKFRGYYKPVSLSEVNCQALSEIYWTNTGKNKKLKSPLTCYIACLCPCGHLCIHLFVHYNFQIATHSFRHLFIYPFVCLSLHWLIKSATVYLVVPLLLG